MEIVKGAAVPDQEVLEKAGTDPFGTAGQAFRRKRVSFNGSKTGRL